LTAACTGRLSPGTQATGTAGTAPGSSGAGGTIGTAGTTADRAACVAGASFAHARISQISDDQYRNIVQDVLGVTFPAAVTVTTLPSTSGSYPYNENTLMGATTMQAYLRAADQVATLLMSTAMSPCTAGVIDATCMEAYLRDKLPRAWRRPVTDAELSGLLAIFESGAPDGQTRQVQLVIEAALIHPAFLFRSELGTGGTTSTSMKVALTPHELASAVSFATLNSSPDAELWAKAQDGSLTQPTVLAAQVSRLLALPKVQANLQKKVSYYLDFETLPFTMKDATAFPEFTALQGTLYQSAQMFLADVVWGGHFNDLFTTRRIYANQAMAKAYGLPAVTGTQLQPVMTTDGSYDAGLLTQPALLAASNKSAVGDDVVHRGLWIHDNLLCAPSLPPPPQGATAVAATITGSSREQALKRDTTCGAACHGHFDPFGLVTLSYDGIGRYRTTDPTTTPPGGPIDDTATVAAGILQGQSSALMLTSASDLAKALVSGRQVSDCAVGNLATYTLEHSPDVEGSCDLQAVRDRFQQTGSFTDLFTAILTSPAFLSRDW
jgi:Protein of unknown function (DUF1592)/Protein of unknown function (DUF1588)/Protein of unknown function (DUF1595)/Protein of unknown function (DUF1587)